MYQLNDKSQAQELWKRSLTSITTANAERSDLAPLRLQLEAKLKQAGSGAPVNVAPTAAKAVKTQQANSR